MNELKLSLLPTIKRDALSPGFSKGFFVVVVCFVWGFFSC